jgi:cyclopropane fatty-acyl-phospholipid synthase-like methyltransferase
MMNETRTAAAVFDEWASDDRARKMGEHHFEVVRRAFENLSPSSGDYLEIGVGDGSAIRWLATHQFARGRCLGIDASGNMAKLARRRCRDLDNVTIEQMNFLRADFGDRPGFDLIFSMEVFYYFPAIQVGIDKAFASLKPGGQLGVMVDYYAENSANHHWPKQLGTPMQLWSAARYRDGFLKAGFQNIDQQILTTDRDEKEGPKDKGTLLTWGTH